MSLFLGTITRGSIIPIALTLEAVPTGTPTYRIIDAGRNEIVAATNLSGSSRYWYKDDQIVATLADAGEYLVEYSAVVNGVTRNATDSYEVPSQTITSGSTTSASSNWTLTRNKIIKQALWVAGVIGEDQEPNANQINKTSELLNQYIKFLQQKHNIKLWKLEWDYKTFSAPSEVTGSDSNIYTCILSHVATAANKPVTGDDWSSYWVLKGTTGSVWTLGLTYSSSGDFTSSDDIIGIEHAYLRTKGASGTHSDSPITIIGNAEYANLATKSYFGEPIQLFFDNKLSPTIFVTPLVENTDKVVVHYQKILRIDDFDGANDNPDFPVHWIEPIVAKLTHKLSMAYHMPISEQREYKREADETLRDVLLGTIKRGQKMNISPKGY